MSGAFAAATRKHAPEAERSGATAQREEGHEDVLSVHSLLGPTGVAGAAMPGQSGGSGSGDASSKARHNTPRYLTQEARGAREPLLIQRQEDASLPAVPRFQLTPPSLLQPRDPYERFYPDFGNRLRLDPDLESRMLALGRSLLSPPSVLADVAPTAPVLAVPGPPGSPNTDTVTGAPVPTPSQPASPSSTPGGPSTPPTTPPPPGTPATGPRPGGGGDVLSAVLALPQVSLLLEDVQNQFSSDFSRYWRSASTGDRVGFVTSSVVVGGAILAPVLGFENPRNVVLPLLNNVVLPIPKLPGYGLEFRFGERDVMIGAHLDVGRLLPTLWGFGEASFSPIGGPPGSDSNAVPPVSRKADGNTSGVDHASVAAGVRSRSGGGIALDRKVQHEVGPRLGANLANVRIHADGVADELARSVSAHAFTSGNDIFFRAGRYDPEGRDGRKLLTHELVHVAQHASAPAQGHGEGLTISSPHDGPEREADRLASHLVEGPGSPVEPTLAAPPNVFLRQPEPGAEKAPKGSTGPAPVPAAAAKKAAPPPWTDYFDEVVPAVLEAVDSNEKVGIERALWLITQAYGEQSPGAVGPPSRHRNRLFNEQAAVEMENGKIKRVLPGQESEGVYLFNLPQNESPTRDRKEMKTSPTFGYDTPERAAHHHVEQLEKRWGGAWKGLTAEKGSFDDFARSLKAAGYAKANDYDTALIALQGQVRSQVAAWVGFRLPEMRARIPQMEEYLEFLRSQRALAAQRVRDEPDPVGHLKAELAHYDGLVQGMELQMTDVLARKDRLERFAGVLGVKVK